MALALFRSKDDPKRKIDPEKRLNKVEFEIYKFNHRPKPKKIDRIKIISCFSEFGCEVLGNLYCIPRLVRRFPGQYIIAMGWYGREYLYRHLVDEFWEIKPEYMWLRDYTRAFHHNSYNLTKIEESATMYGEVIPSQVLGKYAIANFCRTCGKFWHEWRKQTSVCPACQSSVLIRSIFTDIATYKPQAKKIPRPSQAVMDWAKSIVPPNTVGVFARGRKTYGRNLPSDFYVKLINLLKSMGYSIIWLGEKQSSQPCPVEGVIDFTQNPESRDLEKTLAIICQLKFTIQFWTASTRLAGVMGVPFLLFESPEQIFVSQSGIMSAQEGKRLELCSFGQKKLVLSHFKNVYENQAVGLQHVEQAIREMNEGNFENILGQVQDMDFSSILQQEHYELLT